MLRVVRALGLVTVQDLGRVGWMHAAVPVGGALVRGALAAANGAVGNAAGAAAVEVCGVLRVRAVAACTVGVGAAARPLAAGEEIELASGRDARAVYLAVRGGVDAPVRLGGRGTLLCAGLGRVLAVGDVLAPGGEPTATALAAGPRPEAPRPIRVIPGPDAFADVALVTLCASPYRVRPESDRVGTRLFGAALPRPADAAESPRPLVRGAIEVPGDGQPIVLGPEHPTTGGYPVIAVVAEDDLDRLHALPLGGMLRFTR
jgi:allophanate hydrolase subunit 2